MHDDKVVLLPQSRLFVYIIQQVDINDLQLPDDMTLIFFLQYQMIENVMLTHDEKMVLRP